MIQLELNLYNPYNSVTGTKKNGIAQKNNLSKDVYSSNMFMNIKKITEPVDSSGNNTFTIRSHNLPFNLANITLFTHMQSLQGL